MHRKGNSSKQQVFTLTKWTNLGMGTTAPPGGSNACLIWQHADENCGKKSDDKDTDLITIPWLFLRRTIPNWYKQGKCNIMSLTNTEAV